MTTIIRKRGRYSRLRIYKVDVNKDELDAVVEDILGQFQRNKLISIEVKWWLQQIERKINIYDIRKDCGVNNHKVKNTNIKD